MAKNDCVLVDGIIQERLAENFPSDNIGEVFEYFAIEQIMKDYDLSQEQLDFGWIDGRNDGGIDAYYIFVNGHLVEDAQSFIYPKTNASIELCLITCKHHNTFVQAPLDLLFASISQLFDFSIESNKLINQYSEDLLELREMFFTVFKKLSITKPTIDFKILYASRGDTKHIGSSVISRADQVKSIISDLFSSCTSEFNFVGSEELIEKYRKAKIFSLNLPFLEHLTTGESHILLVNLYDYYKFVSDENKLLRRYLFDSNVRDYLGNNAVNTDIKKSLENVNSPDFWWLNNGITILATQAAIPSKYIQLQDIQIVNGLQTTETIFEYFKDKVNVIEKRSLLVKIIVSNNAETRDSIIRATNNQSLVEPSSLHATDKIQRDIEEILEKNGWYYERRKNYYLNIGKAQNLFVTPNYLASAVMSLILKNPHQASKMKTKYMRNQAIYDQIFSNNYPIEVWPILTTIYKKIDHTLVFTQHIKKNEKYIATRKPLIAFLVVSKILNKFSYSITELVKIDLTLLTDQFIIDTINELPSLIESTHRRIDIQTIQACCVAIESIYNLEGIKCINKYVIKYTKNEDTIVSQLYEIDEIFIEKVNELLPEQPWPIGTHVNIAKKLNCHSRKVSQAIQKLIASGKRYRQRDGIIYDYNGEILTWDSKRVEMSSLKEKINSVAIVP